MSRLESSHLIAFSRSSHLTVLTKSMQNTLTILILMGLKDSIEFTAAFSKIFFLTVREYSIFYILIAAHKGGRNC